jgi:GT2 family glycosyltransferase
LYLVLEERGYAYRAKKELGLLKDKFKYWRIIRSLAGARADGPVPAHTGGYKLLIKETLKRIQHSLPEFVVYNLITWWLFKLVVFIVNRKVERLKSTYRSKLELFETDLPEKFDMPAATEPIQVSIIIPVHNKYFFTHRCLYSVKAFSSGISYEVIIADDASSDETAAIQSSIGNLKISRNEIGLGFLGNCNKAAQQAQGKYILFLNNDTVVQDQWLSSLLTLIEHDQTIGMVGSKLIYPEGILQEAGGIVWQDGSGWNYGKMGDPEYAEFNYVKEVDYISGASLMVRSTIWKELDGFDTRYTPAYYEDTDLAFEVRRLGYKVVYQPQSVVVHFEGISHGTDTGSGIKKYQEINKQKFVSKWADTLREEQFPNEAFLFKARERSKHQKTLLFIDHYVPEFDRDAGSKSCFQYLNLFVKMGLNVKFIGDSYIRTEPYTGVLQQLGIEVLYGFEYQQNWKQWILEHAADIDYVFLNRPHVTEKYIDFIRNNTKAKIIYYGHDLHYLREERQYALTKKEELLRSAAMWKQKEYAIFDQADVILYPSFEEIKAVRQTNPNIHALVLPLNVFPRYTANPEVLQAAGKQDLLFVGGFNHPPNEDAVCWFVKEIFPLILESHPEIKFMVVGSKTTDTIRNLASPNIIIKGFVSDEELAQLYQTCRIVVAPLRYGAGVKGKIIEAVYNRCAVVTTPIGAEGINNESGLLTVAETAGSFATAVVSLYENEQRLTQLFNESPLFIEQYFSEKQAIDFVQKNIL